VRARARRRLKVLRIDAEMTLHDAAITRFSQWWTRSVRGGHSFAEGMAMHGTGFSRHNVRHTLSALFYGLALPALWCGSLFFAAAGIGFGPLTLVAVGVPAAYLRAAFGAYRDRLRRGDPRAHAALYAAFCMLGKVPETIGVLTYWGNRLRGRYSGLMEYKPAPAGPNAGVTGSGNDHGNGNAVASRNASPAGVASSNSSPASSSNGVSRDLSHVPRNGMTEPC